MKQHRVTVSGRVQGVFFRAAAKEKADALGLKGTVTNLSDGNVYIEVTGPDREMTTFIDWCRQGPPRAIVHKIEIEDETLPVFPDFRILR
jgi:acylphosphatase